MHPEHAAGAVAGFGQSKESKRAEFCYRLHKRALDPLVRNLAAHVTVERRRDYFVLKPMHSAFYMTPSEVLLRHLQVETLILTGLTSNASSRSFSIISEFSVCLSPVQVIAYS